MNIACKFFVGKCEGSITLERPGCWSKDNIKTKLI